MNKKNLMFLVLMLGVSGLEATPPNKKKNNSGANSDSLETAITTLKSFSIKVTAFNEVEKTAIKEALEKYKDLLKGGNATTLRELMKSLDERIKAEDERITTKKKEACYWSSTDEDSDTRLKTAIMTLSYLLEKEKETAFDEAEKAVIKEAPEKYKDLLKGGNATTLRELMKSLDERVKAEEKKAKAAEKAAKQKGKAAAKEAEKAAARQIEEDNRRKKFSSFLNPKVEKQVSAN